MLWFLRLFPAFRAMEATTESVRLRELVLEDKERWYQTQISHLTARVDSLTGDSIGATKMVADCMAQLATGQTIFSAGPKIEKAPEPEPISGALYGRDAARDLNTPESLAAYLKGDYLKDLEAELAGR